MRARRRAIYTEFEADCSFGGGGTAVAKHSSSEQGLSASTPTATELNMYSNPWGVPVVRAAIDAVDASSVSRRGNERLALGVLRGPQVGGRVVDDDDNNRENDGEDEEDEEDANPGLDTSTAACERCHPLAARGGDDKVHSKKHLPAEQSELDSSRARSGRQKCTCRPSGRPPGSFGPEM